MSCVYDPRLTSSFQPVVPLRAFLSPRYFHQLQAVARAMKASASLPPSHPILGNAEETVEEDYLIERATLLLLIQPPSAWPESRLWPSSEECTLWTSFTDLTGHTIVAAEVCHDTLNTNNLFLLNIKDVCLRVMDALHRRWLTYDSSFCTLMRSFSRDHRRPHAASKPARQNSIVLLMVTTDQICLT